jgi:GTP-binding protein
MIEGASEGIGLGIKFLKHAMRTKIIAHVVDMGALELTDPIESYETIKNEMEKYDKALIEKPSIIIASKMDLPDAEDNLVKFKAKYPNEKIFPISSINNQGLEELVDYLCEEVKKLDEVKLYEDNEKLESHILYKFNKEKPFTITKQDNGVWLLTGREVETLFQMTRFNEDESVERFGRKLKGMGIDKELERLGANRGDDVQIFDYIFEWKD